MGIRSIWSSIHIQEILTVKSDDIVGRVKTYEAIVKGETFLNQVYQKVSKY